MQCRRYVTLKDPKTGKMVKRIVWFGSLGKDGTDHAIFYNDGKLTHKNYYEYKFLYGHGSPEQITDDGTIDGNYSGPYFIKSKKVSYSNIIGISTTIPYIKSSPDLTAEHNITTNIVTDKSVAIKNINTYSISSINDSESTIVADDKSMIISDEDDESDEDVVSISMQYYIAKAQYGTLYYDIDGKCWYQKRWNGYNESTQKWFAFDAGINIDASKSFLFGRGHPNESTVKGLTDDYTSQLRTVLKNGDQLENYYYVDIMSWMLYVYVTYPGDKYSDEYSDWCSIKCTADCTTDENYPFQYKEIPGYKTITQINGMFKNKDGDILINRHDNYSSKQVAVADSLNQKLSLLQGELWWQVNKGWPLMSKSNKLIYDTYLVDTISNHSKVVSITEFQSKSENRHYSAYVKVLTVYGNAEITISK